MSLSIDEMTRMAPAGRQTESALRERDASHWHAALEREQLRQSVSERSGYETDRERVGWRDGSSASTWLAAPRASVAPLFEDVREDRSRDRSPADAATHEQPSAVDVPLDALAEPCHAALASNQSVMSVAQPPVTTGMASPRLATMAEVLPSPSTPSAAAPQVRAMPTDAGRLPGMMQFSAGSAHPAKDGTQAVSVLQAPPRAASVATAGTPFGPRHLQWTDGAEGPSLWIRDADPSFDDAAAMRLAARIVDSGAVPRPARVVLNGRTVSNDSLSGRRDAEAPRVQDHIHPTPGHHEEDSHAH